MITRFKSVLCLSLILYGQMSRCKPLTAEDVEGILPPPPRDKNETLAVVVQDPVVQDAVQHTASNGSLNGLVVKKHVFIMPASDPNTILSKREDILVVPTENLEDVRKNITETKQTEAMMETSSPKSGTFFDRNAYEYTVQEIGSGTEQNTIGSQFFLERDPTPSTSPNEKRKSKTEFLVNTISRDASLPEDQSKKVAVPIVAVIDPSHADKGKVNSPIVAILPNHLDDESLKNQVGFLKNNSDVIEKKARNLIDKSSLTIVPDYQQSSIPSEIAVDLFSTQETVSMPVYSWTDQQEQEYAESMATPQWQMILPVSQDEQADHSKDTDRDTTIIRNGED